MKSETKHNHTDALIWDLPLRVFHWLLPPTITTAWLTTDAIYFEAHLFSGYLLVFLVLFRLIWGFIGNPYAQFRHFAHPWSTVRNHLHHLLQREPTTAPGHNPAAGWMVFILLGVLLSIAMTGLLTLGGEERSGPLQGIISIESGAMMHQVHNGLAWFLIMLIPLHLIGIAVERQVSKRKLVRAMITGGYHAVRPIPAGSHMALISGLLLTSPVLALWLSLTEDELSPIYLNRTWENHPNHLLWQSECSACHTLHHPSLLPARSWQRMMDQSEHHFEEDLALDEEDHKKITKFLTLHAAEQAHSEAAWKISNSIPYDSTPLQITSSIYWKEKHHDLSPALWELPSIGNKIHCDGCHQDAATGHFSDRAIELPGV